LFVLWVAFTPLAGCLFRSHTVAARTFTVPLQTATCNELVERINAGAARIQTLDATVSIATAEGGSEPGEVSKPGEIRGHILARKPSALRLTGFLAAEQSLAFDMVSDGQQSTVWTPTTTQAIPGEGDSARTSMKPFATLRPNLIYYALLLQPIDLQSEIAVLEQDDSHSVMDPKTRALVQQPDYAVDIISHDERGYHLSRKTIFDRTDLQPYEQIIYNENGSVAVDARYFEYEAYDGILIPKIIKIRSPVAERSIEIRVTSLLINGPVSDEQFVIDTPPDTRRGTE
jgi:outer membrane lipoprotein-sorting protein